MHALRLLLNISCCPDMVPYVLAAKPVTGLLRILDTDKDDVISESMISSSLKFFQILVRAVTWLLCMTSAVEALGITLDTFSPYIKDPFHNPTHTLYFVIYGPKAREKMKNEISNVLGERGTCAQSSTIMFTSK